MTKEEYIECLKSPRWKFKKKNILARDRYRCVKCGGIGVLHVHHLKYSGTYPWEAKDKDLITLCKRCHEDIHKIKNGRKSVKLKYGIKGKVKNNDQL